MESCVKNDRYGPIYAEPMFVAQSQGKVFVFLCSGKMLVGLRH